MNMINTNMPLKLKSICDRGTILSLAALQSYRSPKNIAKHSIKISDLSPLTEFLHNKKNFPTFIQVLGTQAYVISNKTDTIVACRGTDTNDTNDTIADLLFKKINYSKGGKVHFGFYSEYSKIINEVKTAIEQHDSDEDKSVWVCGHSLGGAIALLISMDINPAGCYTYGQPRVGDKKFLENINFPYYRYENNNDIVPRLPMSMFGFRHGGKLRYIDMTGNIKEKTMIRRTKDLFYCLFCAIKKMNFFDSLYDHRMLEYHKYIYNMDERGQQEIKQKDKP